MPDPAITLYGLNISGHVHRAVLMLEMLGLPYTYVETSVESRAAPDFLAINPLGQVPVLRDGDAIIADSNAILIYLVARYAPDGDWLPRDPVGAAHVQRWMSIAAGELRYGPALARAIKLLDLPLDPEPPQALAKKLFGVMDAHLADHSFLAADRATLADIALYSYTAHAPEGGVSLDPYPAIRAWLARVEALPGFVPMSRIGKTD